MDESLDFLSEKFPDLLKFFTKEPVGASFVRFDSTNQYYFIVKTKNNGLEIYVTTSRAKFTVFCYYKLLEYEFENLEEMLNTIDSIFS